MMLPYRATLWCITYFHGFICPFLHHFNHKKNRIYIKRSSVLQKLTHHFFITYYIILFFLQLIVNYFIVKFEGQNLLTCIKFLSAVTSFLPI